VVFEADYDEIELQKNSYDVTEMTEYITSLNSYDVILVTSSPLRHRKTSPK